MEKGQLTAEDIRFLDTYLKNSDIQYADVRMELVDHIATAVEMEMQRNGSCFYDAFKDYMVQHKKSLLKEYGQMKKDLQKKAFKILGKKMVKLPFLTLFAAFFMGFYYWKYSTGVAFPYIYAIFSIWVLSMLIYVIGSPLKRYNRLIGLEMLAWPLFMGVYALNLLFNFTNDSSFVQNWPVTAMAITSFFVCANLAFLNLFYLKRREIKHPLA